MVRRILPQMNKGTQDKITEGKILDYYLGTIKLTYLMLS